MIASKWSVILGILIISWIVYSHSMSLNIASLAELATCDVKRTKDMGKGNFPRFFVFSGVS